MAVPAPSASQDTAGRGRRTGNRHGIGLTGRRRRLLEATARTRSVPSQRRPALSTLLPVLRRQHLRRQRSAADDRVEDVARVRVGRRGVGRCVPTVPRVRRDGTPRRRGAQCEIYPFRR